MELEFILTVIIILVAINLIGLGFYAANKHEIATPLEFFRIKINQANVCLSCDNIYHSSEQWCPLCFEREFFPLRDSFQSLVLPQDITKEVDKDGKIHYTLSLVGKEKPNSSPNPNFMPDKFAKYSNAKFGFPQTNQPSRFAPDYSPEPPTTKVSTSNDSSGIGVERESSFSEGSHWAHAGATKFVKAIKDGVILPRKEHTRRV